MHLCGGPGRRCRQPVTNPGETKRKPEFVTGVQGHLGGQWEHGPPSEVSMCEKARVQATRCCSTERRRCQALGVQVQPVGGFPRPVFLLFTKRMFNFLQRNLLPPAGLGGIGGQEPSSELSRLFPKWGVRLQLPPSTPLSVKLSSPQPPEKVKERGAARPALCWRASYHVRETWGWGAGVQAQGPDTDKKSCCPGAALRDRKVVHGEPAWKERLES